MEVLKKICAHDPVFGRVGADAVEVASAGAAVDVGGIGFDELGTGVDQADAIDVRGLRAGVENNWVIVGFPNGEVSDGGVCSVEADQALIVSQFGADGSSVSTVFCMLSNPAGSAAELEVIVERASKL